MDKKGLVSIGWILIFLSSPLLAGFIFVYAKMSGFNLFAGTVLVSLFALTGSALVYMKTNPQNYKSTWNALVILGLLYVLFSSGYSNLIDDVVNTDEPSISADLLSGDLAAISGIEKTSVEKDYSLEKAAFYLPGLIVLCSGALLYVKSRH